MVTDCCGKPLEWHNRRNRFGDHDVLQARCACCSVLYERKPGENRHYILGAHFRTCSECGGPVHSAHVAHAVLFFAPGDAEPRDSHQVAYELVPCCDRCDAKPVPNGTPIVVNFERAAFAAAS